MHAKPKAAYRFLEHPENTMKNIHKSHYEATLSRIKREKVVLAVQDTTTLNYSTHPAKEKDFEDAEWKALVAYKSQDPIPPEKPPKLREAIHVVASLGGFLGRKSDGEPGNQTLWLGLQRLDDITEMWKITISKLAPHLLRPPPVSSEKCG